MTRYMVKLSLYILSLVVIVLNVHVSISDAASTSIIGSKHDFSAGNAGGVNHFAGYWQIGAPTDLGPLIDEVCVFCHTPHGASLDPNTNTLLWNRISSPPSGYSYKPYSSASMTNPAPDTADRKPTGISMMCMSCHDGVTSIAVNVGNQANTPTLLNAPGSGNPQVSIDPFQAGSMPYPGSISSGGAFGTFPANIGDAKNGVGNTIDLSNDHPISFEWASGKAGFFATPQNSALRLFGATGRRIECATCHSVHNPSIEPFLAMSNSQSLMCRACHIK